MRETLLVAGITSSIDELDYYILSVSDMHDKGGWIKPKREETIDFAQSADGKIDVVQIRKAVAEQKLWADEDFTKIGDPSVLIEEIERDKLHLEYLESDLGSDDETIKAINGEAGILQRQIDKYEIELSRLQGLLEFDELPPEDKLKKIKTEYSNKQNGK
jgi:hypothetical protein